MIRYFSYKFQRVVRVTRTSISSTYPDIRVVRFPFCSFPYSPASVGRQDHEDARKLPSVK